MRISPFRWLPIVILLIIVIFGYTEGTKQPSQIQSTPTVLPVKDTDLQRRDDERSPVFDAKAYYSPIVENNLFRPLGWRPKRPIERYRILGTIIPTNTKRPPKAIIQTNTGNQRTYIVTPGQNLDATTEVIDIQPKQVTLSKDGTRRTLQLPSPF